MGSNFADRVKVADGTPDTLPMRIDRFPNGNSGFEPVLVLGWSRSWASGRGRRDLGIRRRTRCGLSCSRRRRQSGVPVEIPEVSKSVGSVNKEGLLFCWAAPPVAFVGIQDFDGGYRFDVLEDDKRGLDC